MHMNKRGKTCAFKSKLCTHAALRVISTGQNPINATRFDKWKGFYKTFDTCIAVVYLIN